MTKQYSIAEARANLPTIVRDAECGSSAELTRRGKPVAVLLSVDEYRRLTNDRTGGSGFWDALQAWRATVDWDEMGDLDEVFRDVRDRSSGREFRW